MSERVSQSIGAVHGEHDLTDDLILGYIAYPESQRQPCMIHCLPADADDLARRRFAREAIIGLEVSRDHESLLTTLHFGHWHDGRLFMALESIAGYAVSEMRAELRGDFASIRRIADSALSALAYLHRRGVAHGDVAADNLLMGADGIVRLGNFSRARRIAEAGEANGDLRALGALLFGLVAGVSVETALSGCAQEHLPMDAPPAIIEAIACLLAGVAGSFEARS